MRKPLKRSTAVDWVLRGADGTELRLHLVPGRPLTVGRDLSADISLLDAGVSRHHATIELERHEIPEGTGYRQTLEIWVEDLHSRSGTFVNGHKVKRALLHEGDIVTFGRKHLTLLPLQGQEAGNDLDESLLRHLSSRDLIRLLRLSRDLIAQKDPASVFQHALAGVVEIVVAERGVVLLFDEQRGSLSPVATLPPEGFKDLAQVASHPLADTVFERGKVLSSRSFQGASSSTLSEPWPRGKGASERTTSGAPIAIAPLHSGNAAIGVIYLERRPGDHSFSPPELELLSALAWVTAPALSLSRQVLDLRASKERLERGAEFVARQSRLEDRTGK